MCITRLVQETVCFPIDPACGELNKETGKVDFPCTTSALENLARKFDQQIDYWGGHVAEGLSKVANSPSQHH